MFAEKFLSILSAHQRRYPLMQTQDCYKLLHQSLFAGGHMIENETESLDALERELRADASYPEPFVDEIGGGLCRMHLKNAAEKGIAPKTLNRMFVYTANHTACPKDAAALIEQCVFENRHAFSDADFMMEMRASHWPAVHHSEAYRAAYRPHYRVLKREFATYMDLFSTIDSGKARLIGIDGNSGAGKTALANLAAQVYDANVFHMDDYFLQPHQRTKERLTEPGGNMDRERFYEEVILPLTSGMPVKCRKYDCETGQLGPEIRVPSKPLNIVEGVYALHPMWQACFDVKVFLSCDSMTQRARILEREGAEKLVRFEEEWIPMEEKYFSAFGIPDASMLHFET